MKKYPTKFDGYYVSEDGSVWSEWHYSGNKCWKAEPRLLPQFFRGGDQRYLKFKGGAYKGVNISLKDDNGRNIKRFKYSVHRLIAETLLDNPHNYPEVDHIDRDKLNNQVNNLRWCDKKMNRKNRI